MELPTAEQLEAEMAALENRRRAAAALLSAMREYEATVSGNGIAVPVSSNKASRRPAPAMEATENVAAELMEKAAGPVPTAEVVAEMQRRGMELPARNAANVISARLSNSDKFDGRRGQGYWFKGRPWPSANSDHSPSNPLLEGFDGEKEIDA